MVDCVNPVLGTCCSAHCQCSAFAQNLAPGRGRPPLHIAQKDNKGDLRSPVSFSGCSAKGVSLENTLALLLFSVFYVENIWIHCLLKTEKDFHDCSGDIKMKLIVSGDVSGKLSSVLECVFHLTGVV